jgi:hypothetical protein
VAGGEEFEEAESAFFLECGGLTPLCRHMGSVLERGRSTPLFPSPEIAFAARTTECARDPL